MKNRVLPRLAMLVALSASGFVFAGAFVSGSTGADGAFAPTSDMTVQLPPSGILHYTTVNIPAGVTIKFAKNSANTAAVILTTGEVNIAGAIDISGGASLTTKYGLTADMNKGGIGGPGGFDGGRGGLQEQNRMGGTGYGPGGGGGGIQVGNYNNNGSSAQCYGVLQGGGGGFAAGGEAAYCVRNNGGYLAGTRTGYGGPAYGSNSMLPLVGGSGGGGGAGGQNGGSLPGSGGGGGGGGLMIVASGSLTLNGSINARGGNAGNINNNNCSYDQNDNGGAGGGGAGGAVRILTPAFSGAGSIDIGGGAGGCRINVTNVPNNRNSGGYGGVGRSSIEIVSGGTFTVSVIPTLTIASIGGLAVPVNPTGVGDVDLPGEQANPVDVTIAASGIPVGTVVKLTLSQPYGGNITANTSALAGTLQSSTATGSISIPSGSSVLMASTTYALTLAMGEAMSVYAQGEQVEKVSLATVMGGDAKAMLITVSGKEFEVPLSVLATIPAQG